MKTNFFASCALATIVISSSAIANDVFVGGNVEFLVTDGEVVNGFNNNFQAYANDTVADVDTQFTTRGDVTFKSNVTTRMIEYGAYVNLDVESTGINRELQIADVDAHIRVRLAHGTLKFGTDIDGLQDVEELDWITAGPKDFNSEMGFKSFSRSVDSAMAAHQFSQGVEETGGAALGASSVTFTTNTLNGFTAAAEVTPSSNDENFEWGASLKFEGQIIPGSKLTAVVGTESSKAVMANAKVTFGDVTLGGMYGKDDDDDQYMGGVLAYDLGALTLSGGVVGIEANSNVANEIAKQQDVALGAAYELAPGLTLDAGVKRINRYAYLSDLEANQYMGRIKLKF